MGVALAFVGALAARLGRFTLAKGWNSIVRRRFLGKEARQNVAVVRQKLSQWKKLAFRSFLSSKLLLPPSNYLFIAYGLTAMEWKPITMPFLLELCVRERGLTGGVWPETYP